MLANAERLQKKWDATRSELSKLKTGAPPPTPKLALPPDSETSPGPRPRS